MAQNRFTQPFKSLNNDIRAFVSFVNTTNRNVCLLWLDYKGKRVRYGDIPPGRGLLINTYVTHPWIAYDAVTSYPLLFNGEMAFFPQEQRDNQVFSEDNRELVSIHIPVYSLYRRCLEVVYLHIRPDVVNAENIPTNIKAILTKMQPVSDFTDYPDFHRMHYENIANIDNMGPPE